MEVGLIGVIGRPVVNRAGGALRNVLENAHNLLQVMAGRFVKEEQWKRKCVTVSRVQVRNTSYDEIASD